MTEHAITLLLCDNRQVPEPPAVCADSVVALPLKRERMRNFAAVHDIQIDGEVILELAKGVDLQFVVDNAVHQVQSLGAEKILCPDTAALYEAGVLQALRAQLAEYGKALTTI